MSLKSDAENLDLSNSSFNAALCRWGLMLLPNLDAAIRKTYSSLVVQALKVRWNKFYSYLSSDEQFRHTIRKYLEMSEDDRYTILATEKEIQIIIIML